jgi:hypothetical protein
VADKSAATSTAPIPIASSESIASDRSDGSERSKFSDKAPLDFHPSIGQEYSKPDHQTSFSLDSASNRKYPPNSGVQQIDPRQLSKLHGMGGGPDRQRSIR